MKSFHNETGLSAEAALKSLSEASPMIVGVIAQPLRIGDIIGIERHPFCIIRECTEDEWRAAHQENAQFQGDVSDRRFYEVSTD